jgi:hypothetical protein
LSYYVAARIAETGYIRNRDLEFTETRRLPKDDVMKKFDDTVAMVTATIREQAAEDFMKAYSAERESEAKERFMILLRCAGHAYHHVGQIIYLTKELAKQAGQHSATA